MYAKMTMYMNNTLLKHENNSIRLECMKIENDCKIYLHISKYTEEKY